MPASPTPHPLRAWQREFREHGLAVIASPALPSRLFASILREAARARATARKGGGGSAVPQANARGALGRAGRAMLRSERVQAFVTAITRTRVEAAIEASCYTYYDRPGHFCGVHRDRADACHVTFLLCLAAESRDAPGPGLALEVFGKRYRDGQKPRRVLPSAGNTLILMRGSEMFHGRPPIRRGERATVLTACFRRVRRGADA